MKRSLNGWWLGCVVGLAALNSLAARAEVARPNAVDEPAVEASQVSSLVRAALEAEARGDGAARARLLAEALRAAPDDAAANWHTGRVRVDDQWVSVEAACDRASADETVQRYLARREQASRSAEDQLALARWCEAAGLSAQERAHLLLALEANPRLTEAVRGLGLVQLGRLLVTPEQRDELQRFEARRKDAIKTWSTKAKRWARHAASKHDDWRLAALREVQAVNDPSAIPALETAFAHADEAAQTAVVEALAAIPDQVAVESLLRFAVLSPHAPVREAAAESLRERSLYSFVPTLMGALRSPIEISFTMSQADGRFLHNLTLFEEGPLADRAISNTDGAALWSRVNLNRPDGEVTANSAIQPDQTLQRDLRMARAAQRENALREHWNDRIMHVLAVTTKQDRKQRPDAWWDWWYDYNEYDRPETRPVYESVVYQAPSPRLVYSETNIVRQPYVPLVIPSTGRARSCFTAGTKVWTSIGPRPIEQITPGELVLAQHPDSGELTFKPVLDTTRRPPSRTFDVAAGDETIRVTRGHPVWVSGTGWQMAKELSAGQWLHTARGPLTIESVEEAPEVECFNLVVADFHTYFVTEAMVLVHDNELREVTSATVPGLVDPNQPKSTFAAPAATRKQEREASLDEDEPVEL